MAGERDWPKEGAAILQRAKDIEATGRPQAALDEYRKSMQVFEYVYKNEKIPKVKEHWGKQLAAIMDKVEDLQERIKNGTTAGPPGGAGGGEATVARPPPTASGGSGAEQAAEDKEKDGLRNALAGAIVSEKPNIKWDDVAGLKTAKEMLQETVILPSKFPQLFTGAREPWHGVLLYGPPGTGKSRLAKACATEADATFFSITASDLVSKWQGESERLVRNLFEMAREQKPSIIFIDEVDSLCGERGGSGESDGARRIKNEFLAQMDGVGKTRDHLLVLGATNTPWDIDSGIRRRFEKRIYIPLPDYEARLAVLKIHIGKTPSQVSAEDLAEIAQRTEGYSGADVGNLVKDAAMEPLRRYSRAKTFKTVMRPDSEGVTRRFWAPCSPGDPEAVEKTLGQVPPEELLVPEMLRSDFESALEKCRPSVGPGDLVRHEEYTQQFGMDG